MRQRTRVNKLVISTDVTYVSPSSPYMIYYEIVRFLTGKESKTSS